MYEDFILESIRSDRDNLVALRRYFHMHPEVSAKEFGTAAKIEEYLHSLGLKTERVGETGVYSEIKGEREGEGKTILLRADIDALPVLEEHSAPCSYQSQNAGISHACGHDAHTASLLEAASFLAAHKDLFSGTVRLAFQQGEEIGYGGRLFVDGGYLDGADRVFGVHMESRREVGRVSLTPGPNNASVDWFRINIHGKAAHVSTPELGIDALYIASQIVIAAQSIVTRRNNPTDAVLIGIGKMEAGTAYNVVAEDAYMEGTLRCMLSDVRLILRRQLQPLHQSMVLMSLLNGRISQAHWSMIQKQALRLQKSQQDCSEQIRSTGIGHSLLEVMTLQSS